METSIAIPLTRIYDNKVADDNDSNNTFKYTNTRLNELKPNRILII